MRMEATMMRGPINSFSRMMGERRWTPIFDVLDVMCFACLTNAAGGRSGFCRDCVNIGAERRGRDPNELGGEG